ncbi:hypothetical protein ACSSS7_000545 [Eimeria intestinalis]
MPLESRLIEVYRQQVRAAAAADQKRQLEDDTKKRAIVSAGSYGAFKALVDGCHLRPLSKEDLHRQPQRRLNPLAAVDVSACPSTSSSSSNGGTGEALIGTQAQLRRQWEARGPNCEEQCRWLMQQPQERLQRLLSVDAEPQLLLQVLQALALHISGLATSRCSSCCCCQTRTNAAAPAAASAAAAAAPAPAAAASTTIAAAAAADAADDTASPAEKDFCCCVAYRMSLTAGFIRFLSKLQGTVKGARLLLDSERTQLSRSFGKALAALHAPLGAHPSHSGRAAFDAANPQAFWCDIGAGKATAPTTAAAASAGGEDCCQTTQAVRMVLQAIGAPPAEP